MRNTFFFVLVLTALLGSCRGSKLLSSTDLLSVQSATSQSWAGGAYGSGQGIKYILAVMPVKYTDADSLNFDTVYTDGRAFTPEVSQKDGLFILTFSYTKKPGINEQGQLDEDIVIENPVKAPLYPKFDGAAMLVFSYSGKKYTLTIPAFTRLDPQFYP